MKAAHVLSLDTAGDFLTASTQVYRWTSLSRLKEATRGAISQSGAPLTSPVPVRPAVHAPALPCRPDGDAGLTTGNIVAATLSHEIRQPLTAIVSSADAGLRFLDRATPDLDRARAAFRRIAADGHRAGAIVECIRTNWSTDAADMTTIDVNELVHDTLTVERDDLQRHGIVVRAEANTQLPRVRGKRVPLQQVLLNLVSNSIDAMASQEEARVLHIDARADSGNVVVSVADTGAGISGEDLGRIFNPLFTTKSRGMGMGLAICRAIIEAHGGRLWHEPNAPRGARFHFTLRAG